MTIISDDYEQRVVAFIDILGFSNHIAQSVIDKKHFKKIRRVLNYSARLKKENDEGVMAMKELGTEVTVFSDSIVVSYLLEHPSSVFYLLMDIIHMQLDLLSEGIVLRGGVAVGKLCHNDNIVFGPAMIEAYLLESKVAKYPRVIVPLEVLEEGVRNRVDHHSVRQEAEYLGSLIREDKDGHYFVDFLKQSQEVEDLEDYFKSLDVIKDVIVDTLATATRKDVIKKIKWLRRYYNKTIKEGFKPKYRKGMIIK